MTHREKPRLEVYQDRSVLIEQDGDEYTFLEELCPKVGDGLVRRHFDVA